MRSRRSMTGAKSTSISQLMVMTSGCPSSAVVTSFTGQGSMSPCAFSNGKLRIYSDNDSEAEGN